MPVSSIAVDALPDMHVPELDRDPLPIQFRGRFTVRYDRIVRAMSAFEDNEPRPV